MSIPELYVRHDAFTDPGTLAPLFDDLPETPSELRALVSRLIMHVAWIQRYAASPAIPIVRETQPVADRLQLIQSSYARSLAGQRPPERRTYGTCRDYALMLCSMLRHRKTPARVRCGFATYFSADAAPYEDHWICEYWSSRDARWRRADAQIDEIFRERLGIAFNCADVPGDAFLSAPQAWRLARAAGADVNDFGHGDTRGLWFLRVDVHRDLLALVNQHVSAWDGWRAAPAPSKVLGTAEAAAIDRLMEVIEAADRSPKAWRC